MTLTAAERDPFLAEHTLERAKTLVADLRTLKKDKKFTYTAVAKACLEPKASQNGQRERLSRWFKDVDAGGDWRSVSLDEFHNLLAYVMNIRARHEVATSKTDRVPHAMFFGLQAWLKGDEDTQAALRQFAGTYAIYRHSVVAPGKVAAGRLTIDIDAVTDAVMTEEYYEVENGGRISEFTIRGYLGRRRGKFYVFAQHEVGADLFVQFSFIDAHLPGKATREAKVEVIQSFSGVLSDIQEGKFYSSRFACLRDVAPEVGVVDLNQVPLQARKVLAREVKFVAEPGAIGYIVEF